jgi:hypothetical protein
MLEKGVRVRIMAFAGPCLTLACIVWGYILMNGIAGYKHISEQHVQGFPNNPQLVIYVIIPFLVFITTLGGLVFHRYISYKYILAITAVLSLLLVFPYFIIARGGV